MNHYTRPAADEFDPYYQVYLEKIAPERRDVLRVLRDLGYCVLEGLKAIGDEQARFRYAEGKWSVKEVIGHLIDTERLFAFRALWIARGSTAPQPGMDENHWAGLSNAGRRTRPELWKEHHVTRTNHLYLFRSFDAEAVARRGEANGSPVSVNALPWLIAGHEMHHLLVLRERYGIDWLAKRGEALGA
jgi:hypothetical protein